MKKVIKTNAMRLLDQANIKYETYTYDLAIDDFDGEKVSEILGVDPASCFKTLALKCEHDLYICCIPVNSSLDLKKSAKALGVKHLEMIKVKDLLSEVGYQRGSTSPIGIKKKHQVCFDQSVLKQAKIEISAGKLGMSLMIDTKTLINYLAAEVKDLCKEEE